MTPSSWLAGLTQDCRYAGRLLRRQPRHALLTSATLALGVGATTLLFSIAYGVLAKPFPWPNAARLAVLKETRGGSPPRFGTFTNAAYLAWRDRPTTIDGIAAWSSRVMTLTGAGEPERIRVIAATASLFPVLGVQPLAGAFFEPRDETAAVVVLSERLWRQRFGGAPEAVGKPVLLDGQSCTVIGILPDAFAYPDRQTLAMVPYHVPPATTLAMLNAIALLRPGGALAQAASEGTALARLAPDAGASAVALFGSGGPIDIVAEPLTDALAGDVRTPLIVLLTAVGLLLVAATANAAGLQLVRAASRTREMTIRAALGAAAPRLTRQLLVENLATGLTGGAAGLAFTWLTLRSMPSLLPADFPRADSLHVDATVLIFALALSIGVSLGCGSLPAIRARRLDLAAGLAGDGTAPGGVAAPARGRARALLMSAQIAVACVLLIGASLLGQSFAALVTADRGYDLAGVLSARVSMPAALYPSAERRFAIVDAILPRLAQAAGPNEVAFTSELPLTAGGSTTVLELRSPSGEIVTAQASPRIVSPRYFAALRIATLAGRTFSDDDTASSEPVVVINRVFADRYLRGGPVVGTRIPMAGYASADGRQPDATVIGVVDAVRYVSGTVSSQPELFYSYRQMGGGLPVQTVTLLVRSPGDPAAAAPALKTAVREADPRLVAEAILPLEQRLRTTLARPRLYAVLLGGFAGFALLIASVGLFGVLSYSVSLRSRELAIRTALGASRGDLVRLVLGQGAAVALGGVAAGTLAAAWLAGGLSAQLYGVDAHDPRTFIAVPLALMAVALVVSVIPAIRAARPDPMRVLRAG